MLTKDLKPGKMVALRQFSEDPLQAIGEHLSILDMAPPDPAALKEHEVLIAIKSASVNWVDLLMTSGH